MMQIHGKVVGDKEVAGALRYAPNVFVRYVASWLKDERARFVGGKDSKGQKRKGYRDILAGKKLSGGRGSWSTGTWSRRITHLFKGYIPHADKLSGLYLKAGTGLRNPTKIHRGLWQMQSGGSTHSTNLMPIPVYKNLAKIGYFGPWHGGNSRSGMKSKAFRYLSASRGLAMVPMRGKDGVLFFDSHARKKRGDGYLRSGLLFVGMRQRRISKQFTGRYDFFGRWDRMVPAMLNRGGGVVDRAAKAVLTGRAK